MTTGSYVTRVLDTRTGKQQTVASGDSRLGFGWDGTRWPWSANSKQFAIGAEDGLRVFAADLSSARQVTSGEDSGPAWSPDGERIAFNDYDNGLSVVDANGGGLRRLAAEGDDPQWSPDGREIAYTTVPEPDYEVTTFVIGAYGGVPRKIAAGDFAWSPDSRTLAIARDSGGLALYGRDDTLEGVLLKSGEVEDPTWSPDGRSVVAVVNGDLWLFTRDGSSTTELTQGARYGYVNSDPTWSRKAPPTVSGTPVRAQIPFGPSLTAIVRTSGRPLADFPHVSGRAYTNLGGSVVSAIVTDGHGGWYIGGDFVSVGDVRCPNLVHIGSNNTVKHDWCPRPDGAVFAIARIGTTLFIGGEFRHLAGQTRDRLAAFSSTDGHLTSWNPSVGGSVYDLASSPNGDSIYLSGLFSSVGKVKRSNFAAVDARTGRPTAFAPNPDTDMHDNSVSAFAVTQTRVYAWGYYGHIGGKLLPVAGSTAQLDARSGALRDWQPASDGGPYSTAVLGDRVFVGGVFHSIGGKRRDDLASFAGSTAAVDAWTPTTGPNQVVEQISPSGPMIIAALTRDHWEPGRRQLVAYSSTTGRRVWHARVTFNGPVVAIAASNDLILAGGAFTKIRTST